MSLEDEFDKALERLGDVDKALKEAHNTWKRKNFPKKNHK
jgi:hypothetical protein